MSTPGGQYYYQSQQQDMANYVRPPETVFSAVQYYPMATIKPCAPVVHDVPFLSISHGDYTLTDPTDAEYSFYNSLLDNANPQLSGGSNLLVRQQYDIAREMLMNSGGAMASM
ncbi:hypothetical protein BC938DRAFT_483832 [Jimgerdemannia flammicorona]|uniref:Uncharacterized protein n=1 Tax=Jimgerdemannia flammicorona TaxID=994334 RepID=A0A433QB58_9FUNG|nr:hypothetical protein BC938DRAFT_483832 [Jimgerdemannia flammicorona]